MKHKNVSAVDLVILGLLIDHPLSSHDLVKLIKEKHATKLIKISAPAIYKNCKQLTECGYLAGEVIRTGEQFDKTIYKITEKGHGLFSTLMAHFSSNIDSFFFDWNAFVFHIGVLKRKEAIKMLEELNLKFQILKGWIVQHEDEEKKLPFANRAIIKQYRMIIIALCEWSSEVLVDYKNLKYKK